MAGGSPDDVEAAFYEALQRADLDLLMGCWADDEDIVCVHPGGARLTGALAVRAAFEGMLSQGPVHVKPVQVHRLTEMTSAVHSVLEQVEVMLPDGRHLATVLATNVYHKTPQGWRMVAHHASAAAPDELHSAQAQRAVLH